MHLYHRNCAATWRHAGQACRYRLLQRELPPPVMSAPYSHLQLRGRPDTPGSTTAIRPSANTTHTRARGACMAAALECGSHMEVTSPDELQSEAMMGPMVDFSFMRSSARLTKSAQMTWVQVVQPGDTVVDATCGNGHDTLALAQLVGPTGTVYAFDVQEGAVAATQQRLSTHLPAGQVPKLHILQQCHSQMQQVVGSCMASCIVFNLGYCPGGDKQLTTQVSSTLAAVEAALEVIKPGGMISIMLYHAHDEGQRETPAVCALAAELNPAYWVCTELQLVNRPAAPHLLTIWRRDDTAVARTP